ncbi:S_locus_glycop domain-containing protein/B_lectin domain-containing protein/PAN_2 domain-containing protein [Cephalotus follicularis]|uniref:non-specific serine/threonine protein kinase n=1 Tax=Cephalotus follicularis TaxID=3775 RepID=A0A1Q3DAG8_CEPFO|nr:S_locus_glycop domain-containing protein/B_lectin domain-containing protein/PAN_2 domain-containing protein [Cephalotus follicularis]
MYPVKWSLNACPLFLIFQFCTSIDTITPNFSLKDGDELVSRGNIFTLGFFSPGNSKYRYIGIWYYQVPYQTVVWVANRNNPINDTSGVLAIDDHGNLVLSQKNQTVPIWSTNVSVAPSSNFIAQLCDSGNLVLVLNDTRSVLLWQSFDYPTDTMLPSLKLGLNRSTGLNRFLTSWRSQDDPGIGNCSYMIDSSGFPQLVLYKGSVLWWRTGSWTGQSWSGVPEMISSYIFNTSYVNNQVETSIVYDVTDASIITRMTLNESGIIGRFTWNSQNLQWIGFWSAPIEVCDYYGHCGVNSNCDPTNVDNFECTCLPGFEPHSSQEWFLRDGSGGCVRKAGVSPCTSGEGFVKLPRIKVPDTSMAGVDMSLGLKECEEKCLRNCSCVAYASAYYEGNKGGIGCLTWYGDLVDARTYSNFGQDLYVRVDANELAMYASKGPLGKKGLTAILVVSVVAMFLIVFFLYWLVSKKRRVIRERWQSKYSFSLNTNSPYFEESPSRVEFDENERNSDLPLFDLSTIAAATDNFSSANKLGEGGFGPVYKGVLTNGREIAVKRLSKYSGQGIEEFKNELTLIAKL